MKQRKTLVIEYVPIGEILVGDQLLVSLTLPPHTVVHISDDAAADPQNRRYLMLRDEATGRDAQYTSRYGDRDFWRVTHEGAPFKEPTPSETLQFDPHIVDEGDGETPYLSTPMDYGSK